jgi:hypothetical protein
MNFFMTEMQLVEELVSKCSGAAGVSKEAESVGEFDRDSRCGCVSRVGNCQECCYCAGNR